MVGNGTAFGYVWLSAANDYSAGTTINSNGRLIVSNAGSLGGGAVSISAGGGLNLRDNVTVGNALTLNGGPSDLAFGALHGTAGANAYGGNITVATGSRIAASNTAGNSLTVNGNITLGSNGLSFTAGSTATYAGGDIIVAGTISGTGGVTKNNATGTLTLTGANTGWSGNATIQGGNLAIGNAAALGTGTLLTMGITGSVATPGIRSTDATTRTITGAFGTFVGNSNSVYTFGAATGGTGNLNFSNTANASIGTAARIFAVHNTTRFSGGFTSTGSITKTGNGTMIMNGTSTYSGGTTVNAGTLGGNGKIGALTSIAGTTIAPGDGGTGTLQTGAATVAGTFAVEVDGANCDKLLSTTGAIDLSGATLTVTLLGGFSGPYVIAEGTSVTGTMTVPPGYAVDVSNGTQAILTQTGTPANFAGWASANGVTGGPNGDSDNDGIPNAVEYGLNLNFAGSDGAPGSFSGNVVTFNKRTATSGNSDLTYRIVISSDLGVTVPWTEVGSYIQNTTSVISAALPNGPAKNFASLQVIVNP